MDAKKCDVCGEYYTDNDNECGLDNCEGDAVTNIEIMCCQNFDTKLDLCDTCAERLIAWIKGDAIIIHKKTLGYLDEEGDRLVEANT